MAVFPVSPSRIAGLATLVLALSAATPATAQETGDAAAGRRLAGTWCSNCHLVEPRGTGTAADAAPPFAAVARMPSTTEMSLRAFLRTPHHNMPDYQLSRTQTDEVVAYILSLRGR